MATVVTFGELMIRLQPYNYERFVQADRLAFTFGGGEANVAVSLANYGVDTAFVTKLPAHAIGQCAVNSLRRYGVDTSRIVRGGSRVGIYFSEKGGGVPSGQSEGDDGLLRPELPRQALDPGRGEGRYDRALPVCGCVHLQRGRTPRMCSALKPKPQTSPPES